MDFKQNTYEDQFKENEGSHDSYQDFSQNTRFRTNEHEASANRNSDGPKTTRDPRAAYAKEVQRVCKDALRRVKQTNMFADSNWAGPLTAAPIAISVMAFLLKTAADKKVAGLPMDRLNVMDTTGKVVLGELPSKYFHTNLQHCSDIGRLAFLEAQKRMVKVNAVARSMMEDGGSVSYIVELLEDAEDARYNLKPEIEALKTTAANCRVDCDEIRKKFEYWQRVIMHLELTAKDLWSDKSVEQEKVGKDKTQAEIEEEKYKDKATARSNEINRMKEKLDLAVYRVSRAQDELDLLLQLPPIKEPSHFEDLAMAQRLEPMTSAPKIQRGWLADTGASIFGYSASQSRQNKAHAEEHAAKKERRQLELIAEERARRAIEIKKAEARLQEARDTEAQLYDEIAQAVKDLSLSESLLVEAKADLAKASADLQRLGNQELELSDILEILRDSTAQLGKLKSQLDPLIDFFSDLETSISEEVMVDVDRFLAAIEQNMSTGPKTDEVTSVHLRGATKRKVQGAAIQIQGRFSTIADVSSAYVLISNNYIRKAINMMEHLSTVKDKDWDDEREIFEKWCKRAIDDINGISKESTENMDINIAKRIGMLERRAIEAKAEAEDEC